MTKIEQLEQKVKRLEQKICCKTQFFDTVDDLPTEGSTGVIYVTDDGNIYVWNGVDYILNGLGDAYYTNSYVERLKALGSNVQYSTTFGGSSSTLALTDGSLYLNSIYINKESVINTVSTYQATAGSYTPDNYNGVGIYSFDILTATYTLIGSSANTATLWTTAPGVNSINLSTPLTLQKGVYFIGILYNNSAQVTAPVVGVVNTVLSQSILNNITLPANTFLASVATGQSTLPTTLLGSATTATSTIIHWLH